MRELTQKAAFFVLALPFVLRAAWRVHRLEPRHALPELVDRLRAVGPFRLAYLNNPCLLEGSVGRLLPLLPLRDLGPCLKRSFVLLDLWSRCGLEPRLHFGIARGDGARCFHAWVTTPQSSAASPVFPKHAEIWSS